MTKPETTTETSIAEVIAPMGAPHGSWPRKRASALRLPKGYSIETTITDESIDRAFTEMRAVDALVFVASAYTSAVYAPMTRAALLSGDDSEEECPATLRSYK